MLTVVTSLALDGRAEDRIDTRTHATPSIVGMMRLVDIECPSGKD